MFRPARSVLSLAAILSVMCSSAAYLGASLQAFGVACFPKHPGRLEIHWITSDLSYHQLVDQTNELPRIPAETGNA